MITYRTNRTDHIDRPNRSDRADRTDCRRTGIARRHWVQSKSKTSPEDAALGGAAFFGLRRPPNTNSKTTNTTSPNTEHRPLNTVTVAPEHSPEHNHLAEHREHLPFVFKNLTSCVPEHCVPEHPNTPNTVFPDI